MNKYYISGKPCKNGHITKRYAKSRYCVECNTEKMRLRRQNPLFVEREASRNQERRAKIYAIYKAFKEMEKENA